MTKEKVVVKINGAEYTLKGDGSEPYLYSIASYVDKMIKDVLASNPMHSSSSASVLTALTIADDLFRANEKLQQIEKEVNIPRDREEKLRSQYDKLKEAYVSVKSENDLLEENNLKISTSMETLEKSISIKDKEVQRLKEANLSIEEEVKLLRAKLKESEEVNKILIKKNDSIKAQAMEALIEATTLRKEVKDFKEARLNSKMV
ncbi:MAG: cell division protein ZapA, partial [Clostridium sp.]